MLNLTVAVTRNPRFEPLIDNTITSKLVNLQFVVTTPPELFYRNLKYDEFDVFERQRCDWPGRYPSCGNNRLPLGGHHP